MAALNLVAIASPGPMSPGPETRELVKDAVAAAQRENRLEQEAHRQRDWRKLVLLALTGLIASLGVAAAGWNLWLERGHRLDDIEAQRSRPEAPAPPAEKRRWPWNR